MTIPSTNDEDNPRFTIEELLNEFDLTLDPAPSFPKISGPILDEHSVLSNSHFIWLVERGLLARNSKPSNGWHKMICPLVHEHMLGPTRQPGFLFRSGAVPTMGGQRARSSGSGRPRALQQTRLCLPLTRGPSTLSTSVW
jgi:hypothetical protein